MAVPTHYVEIFQKPKLGNSQLGRFVASNYRHSINANGWFDEASCDIALRSRDEMELFLDQYLGNRVAVVVENPAEPVWEGLITRLSFNSGGAQWSISVDGMANRLAVTYTDNAGSTITSTLVSDTASQALYGIKNERVELQAQNTGTGIINAIRDTILTQRAWPQASIIPGAGKGLLHIEMQGFYHTLEWDVFQDATVANATLSNYLSTILLPNVANGATFFNNADVSGIITNAITVQRTNVRGETIWDRMQMVREAGDAAAYWVVGITPTRFNKADRILYYRPANSAIEYTARLVEGLKVRNIYGAPIDPWLVRPDRGIRITDKLIGWSGIGDNPTETYIQNVEYNANSQTAIWQGDDDRTAEGVFNFRRRSKTLGKRFGAPPRV